MQIDMTAYSAWCNEIHKGQHRRDSGPRRQTYQIGYLAGQQQSQESQMNDEQLKYELATKRAEQAAVMLYVEQGRALMRELATAADGLAMASEPFPAELNTRVAKWCQDNMLSPVNSGLPANKRVVGGQPMHWNGIPVEVEGVVTCNPANWPLIESLGEHQISEQGTESPEAAAAV